jgi:hypothetical protein
VVEKRRLTWLSNCPRASTSFWSAIISSRFICFVLAGSNDALSSNPRPVGVVMFFAYAQAKRNRPLSRQRPLQHILLPEGVGEHRLLLGRQVPPAASALFASPKQASAMPARPTPNFFSAPRRVTDWAMVLVSSSNWLFITFLSCVVLLFRSETLILFTYSCPASTIAMTWLRKLRASAVSTR